MGTKEIIILKTRVQIINFPDIHFDLGVSIQGIC